MRRTAFGYALDDMLDTVRSLLAFPRQLGGALQATTDVARRLPELQRVITERLGSVDRGVRDALAALIGVAGDLERVLATIEPQHARVAAIERGLDILPAVAADLAQVRATVEPQHARVEVIQHAVGRLEERLAELQRTLQVLETNVEDATEKLPDSDAPGPIARARDTLTGRS